MQAPSSQQRQDSNSPCPEEVKQEGGSSAGNGAQRGSNSPANTSRRKTPAMGVKAAGRRKAHTGKGVSVHDLTLEVLRLHFFLNRQEAASKLGVCVNTIKSACAIIGIKRWPFRKLQGLNQRLKEMPRDSSDAERRALHEEMENIIADPNREEADNEMLVSMKRRHYKRRYYKKKRGAGAVSRTSRRRRESPSQSQDSTEAAAETTGRQYNTRRAQQAAAAAACGGGAVDSQPQPAQRARGGIACVDWSDEGEDEEDTDSDTPDTPGSPSELGSSPPGELAGPEDEKPAFLGNPCLWHLAAHPEEEHKPDVSAFIFHNPSARNKPPPLIKVKEWAEEERAHTHPDHVACEGDKHAHAQADHMACEQAEHTHAAPDPMVLSPELKRKATPRTSASNIPHAPFVGESERGKSEICESERDHAPHASLPPHPLSLLSPTEAHPTRSSTSVIPHHTTHATQPLTQTHSPQPQQQQEQAHPLPSNAPQRAQHAQHAQHAQQDVLLRSTHSVLHCERASLHMEDTGMTHAHANTVDACSVPLPSTLSAPHIPEVPALLSPQLESLLQSQQLEVTGLPLPKHLELTTQTLSEHLPAMAPGGGPATTLEQQHHHHHQQQQQQQQQQLQQLLQQQQQQQLQREHSPDLAQQQHPPPHTAQPHLPQLACRTAFTLQPHISISPVSSIPGSPMPSDAQAMHAQTVCDMGEEDELGAAMCRSDGVLSGAARALRTHTHMLRVQAHSNSSSGSQFRMPPTPPAPHMPCASKSASLPTVVQSMREGHSMHSMHSTHSMHSARSVGSGPPSFLAIEADPEERGCTQEEHTQLAQHAQRGTHAAGAAAGAPASASAPAAAAAAATAAQGSAQPSAAFAASNARAPHAFALPPPFDLSDLPTGHTHTPPTQHPHTHDTRAHPQPHSLEAKGAAARLTGAISSHPLLAPLQHVPQLRKSHEREQPSSMMPISHTPSMPNSSPYAPVSQLIDRPLPSLDPMQLQPQLLRNSREREQPSSMMPISQPQAHPEQPSMVSIPQPRTQRERPSMVPVSHTPFVPTPSPSAPIGHPINQPLQSLSPHIHKPTQPQPQRDRLSSMVPVPHVNLPTHFVPTPLGPPVQPVPQMVPTKSHRPQQQQQQQQKSARTSMDQQSADAHARQAHEARIAQRQRNFIELSKELMLKVPKLASGRSRARTHSESSASQTNKNTHNTTRPQSRALRSRASGSGPAVRERQSERLKQGHARSPRSHENERAEDVLVSVPVGGDAGAHTLESGAHAIKMRGLAGSSGSWQETAGGALHGMGGSWHGGDSGMASSKMGHGAEGGALNGAGGSWHGGDQGVQLGGFLHSVDPLSQHGPASRSTCPDLPTTLLPPIHTVRPQQMQPDSLQHSPSDAFSPPLSFFAQPPSLPQHPTNALDHSNTQAQSPLEVYLQSLSSPLEPDPLQSVLEESRARGESEMKIGDLSMQDLMMGGQSGGLGSDLVLSHEMALAADVEHRMEDVHAHSFEHALAQHGNGDSDLCLSDAMADFLDDLPADVTMLQPAPLPGLHAGSKADARGQDNYLASQGDGFWGANPRLQ